MIIVIGNGESRASIDINNFAKNKITVGCNAIYRDLQVNHLVCCDQPIMREALDAIPPTTLMYVRSQWFYTFKKLLKYKNIRQLPDIPNPSNSRHDHSDHWGSGAYALLVASSISDSHILLIGFDLYSKGELVNNIYKDTENYSSSNTRAVDPSYWIYHISKVFKSFPLQQFIVVNTDHWIMPELWKLPNVTFVSLNKIQEYLQTT